MQNDKLDLVVESAKATPPVAVVGTYLAGIPLNDWVLCGSALLILIQLVLAAKKLWDTFVKKG